MVDALHRTEVRDVRDEHAVLGDLEAGPDLAGGRLGGGREALEIDEVGNDFDAIGRDVEGVIGVCGEEGARRGQDVLLFDREARQGVEALVPPDQGDVGAVQGAGQLDVGPPFLAQDLAGHPRGLRVRDGVVRMDDLDAVVLDQLDQLVGQVQRVGLVTEEGVLADFDRMEEQVGPPFAEAEGAS